MPFIISIAVAAAAAAAVSAANDSFKVFLYGKSFIALALLKSALKRELSECVCVCERGAPPPLKVNISPSEKACGRLRAY